jgi:hypothetical protein
MKPSFLANLPDKVLEVVETGRAAVLGGAVRAEFDGTKLADIDVYVFSQEEHGRLASELRAVEVPGTNGWVYAVPGINSGPPVEIIFEPACINVGACVARADFDIASGAYCAGQYAWASSFPEATKTKIMRFLPAGAGTAQRSYMRYIRYNCVYGYRIDGSIQKLLELWRHQARIPAFVSVIDS